MDYRQMAADAARRHNLPVPLFMSLVNQESRFNPRAQSHAGAMGLGQLMPGTARELGVSNPWDPGQNLDGAARYFRTQLDAFGDPILALAAYNAGPNRQSLREGRVPAIPETQQYVKLVSEGAANFAEYDTPLTDAQRIGDEAMVAIGRPDLADPRVTGETPPMPSMSTSNPTAPTGGGGMMAGLLGLLQGADAEQEAPSWLERKTGGFLNRDRMDKLAIGLEGMTLNPNQQLMSSLSDGIKTRAEDRKEAGVRNRTAAWLAANGREDLAALLAGGSITGGDAVKLAMTPAEDERTALIQEYEYARAEGFQGTLTDYLKQKSEGNRTSVTLAMPGEPGYDAEMRKALMGKQGELWATFLDAGAQAVGAQNDLMVLQELAGMAPSGPISGRLAEQFPEFSDTATAFTSIISRVAPTLRVPGSGATSDLEFQKMLDSLPKLRNSAPANQAIAGMMLQKAQLNAERAKVVQQYQMDGDYQRAVTAMAELDARSIMPPELRSIIDGLTGQPAPGATPAPTGGTTWTDPDTGAVVRRIN